MTGGGRAPADRPYIWANCAVSLDGRLAFAGGKRARLSGPEDLGRVHRLRAVSGAILVGVGTVIADDPSLRVRPELVGAMAGPPPIRVVLDGSGRLPAHAKVLDGSAPTVVATTSRNRRKYPPPARTVVAGTDSVDLAQLFGTLRADGVEQLLVEGGSRVLASLLRSKLVDRLTVYYAPLVIGGASAPPMVGGPDPPEPEAWRRFRVEAVEPLGDGFVATFVP